MLLGHVGRLGKFRLTDGIDKKDLPASTGSLEAIFSCQVDGVFPQTESALILEVMIPRGPRIIYGLLGGRFIPANDGRQLVVKAMGGAPEEFYEDALIARVEAVRVGLPAEYARAAARGVWRAIEHGAKLHAGSLEFCYAGHGDSSSNELIFDRLGYAITNLLCTPTEKISDKLVEEFLV